MLLNPVVAPAMRSPVGNPLRRQRGRSLTAAIRALFANGEQGAWYDLSDLSTLYQDAEGTTPVTATGQPLGRINDKSGNGRNATQATSTARPTIPAAGYRLRGDFTDDFISASIPVSAGEAWINTPWGHYASPVVENGTHRLPLNDATEIVITGASLTSEQRTKIATYFGTSRKYMVALCNRTTVSSLRIYTGGATTNLLFVGANGVEVTKTLSANSDSSFNLATDGLTAPVAVVWPESLVSNTALTRFYCYNNQLTGSIPSLSANTALSQFYCNTNQLTGSIPSLSANTSLSIFHCSNNQLTGSIPSLSANTALSQFYCYTNQLTGSIPSLSANTALSIFYCSNNQLTGSIPSLSANTSLSIFSCYSNQLTGWAGGTIPASLTNFQAQDNLLPQATVNALLAAFDAAGASGGTLNLGGTGNAAPSGAGITAKNNLISRGWTVTTN